MVVTRSGKTVGSAVKIKFSDDGTIPDNAEIVSVDTRESTREPEGESESESDDSDSDEAPEEESIATSKQASIQKQKEQQRLQQELRKQEREKRKQRDEQFKQQQEAKKEKIKQLAQADELPDFLPDEVFESDLEEQAGGKHMRAEDFEKQHEAARKRLKLERLKQLKEQREKAVNKGPVLVKVQTYDPANRRVPPAEESILQSKNAWLQRPSLGKK